MTDENPLRMKRCECGICDESFLDADAVSMARAIARHWNDEHGDELEYSEEPFRTEEYGGRHLHGDEYAYRVHKEYITVYDVLNPDGDKPFKYQYVKKPEARDVCEDCWRSIQSVDGYREIDDSGWRTKYRCDECQQQRDIERRKEQNESLGRFA